MTKIRLPNNNWLPRDYQRPLWNYLERGGKRAIGMWHRRAGKDDVLLNWAAVSAFTRVGSYWHCLPEFAQCRRAIWTAVDPMTGMRRIDQAFPHELRENTNEQEMFIRFKNGSTWQMVGSDRYDNLVGAGVAGVAFSEFALANPSAWGYIRPMVEANDGWAAFISTPRGRNHFKDLFDMAAADDEWFAESLSVEETGALSPRQIEKAKLEYVTLFGEDIGNAQYEQEYLVSFNAAILGAYYAHEMRAVRNEGRIDPNLAAIPSLPVHRAWDLGKRDDTSIWWFQIAGPQIYLLDCYSKPGQGDPKVFAQMIHEKNEAMGWESGTDYVPHDARQTVWGMERGRLESMMAYGLNPSVVPPLGIMDGINAARRTLPRCVFHPACEDSGIKALEQYCRDWDDERKIFKDAPRHDKWSHAADAFRYLALAWQEEYQPPPKVDLTVDNDPSKMTLDSIMKMRNRR